MIPTEQMEALRKYDSPTICNAIEKFKIRSQIEGYLHYSVKHMFPCEKPMIGYAATARFTAQSPAGKEKPGAAMIDYYRYLQKCPRPAVAVFEDTDYPDHVAAVCGEVMATCHLALGCVGLVTNGGVRDMKEVRALRFGYFARDVMVSHGYLHCLEYGCPVDIMGTRIDPGNLLFCDDQGIVVIPERIVAELPGACADAARAEWGTLTLCRESILHEREVDMDRLDAELKRMSGKAYNY